MLAAALWRMTLPSVYSFYRNGIPQQILCAYLEIVSDFEDKRQRWLFAPVLHCTDMGVRGKTKRLRKRTLGDCSLRLQIAQFGSEIL